MGQRIRKILGTVLQIVVASALIGIVVFAVMVFPWFRPCSPKIDQVTHDKAIFLLNWGKIGDKSKIQRVIHSYESPPTFTGDGIDAYCLQIDRFPEDVLQKEDSGPGMWLIPSIDDALLVEALKTASLKAQSDNLVWFPSEELW